MGDTDAVVVALDRGDYELVEQLCAPWVQAQDKLIRDVARNNLASSLMRQGRLDEALRWYTDAVRAAFCAALAGQLELADAYVATARPNNQPVQCVLLGIAQAILAARRGDAYGVVSALDAQAHHFPAAGAQTMRIVGILRAYATGDMREVPYLQPAHARELPFLGAAWPEMAQFLASIGL
jgi:hypothetical protein